MNNFQLAHVLERYPVTVCSADEVRYDRGSFVISNTQKSDKAGEHWVAFYFPRKGPDEFFDYMGQMPEYYGTELENNLTKRFYISSDQIQDSNSDLCGQYCVYYVMRRHEGYSMQSLVNVFNRNDTKNNDVIIREWFKIVTKI